MTFYRASEYHDSAVNAVAIDLVTPVSREKKKPYEAILSLIITRSDADNRERGAHKRARSTQTSEEHTSEQGAVKNQRREASI